MPVCFETLHTKVAECFGLTWVRQDTPYGLLAVGGAQHRSWSRRGNDERLHVQCRTPR